MAASTLLNSSARGQSPTGAVLPVREVLVFGLFVVAFFFATYVMYFPASTFFGSYSLGEPEPFSRPPLPKPFALPLLFATTACVLAVGIGYLQLLLKRPYRLVLGVFLLGVTLNFALIASLRDGTEAFHRRALLAGHGEFLIEAVMIRDLNQTIHNYEAYVRGHPERVFMSAKGPGVISLFYGLKRVATATPMRPLLQPFAPSAETVASILTERGAATDAERIEELRYLLAFVFLLFPFLTYLPTFLIFWLGNAYGAPRLGAFAAVLYPFVPATSLQVAHLDFALFPFFATGVLGLFGYGLDHRRFGYVALSAALFTVYFTMTLAAVSLLAGLLSYLCFASMSRIREGDTPRQVALDAGQVVGVFALVIGGALLAFYETLHFDPIARYAYARALQRDWITREYDLFWVNSNLLGYLLSFGLMYAICLLIQQWRSGRKLYVGTADALDHLTLSWLCVLVALIAFGRQHGETNRLWAFLNPIGCLITARLLYDSIAWRRLGWPLLVALSALILARYRLNYF